MLKKIGRKNLILHSKECIDSMVGLTQSYYKIKLSRES
jgi:hypothetical protein